MRGARLNQKIVVLMYHEIADDSDEIDAWTVVRKSEFIRQMEYLSAHFDILSTEDALERMRSGQSGATKPAALITFDDGYSGNNRVLLPIVKSMNLPVTVFVASWAVEEGHLYWYDHIINALQGRAPVDFDLKRHALDDYRINRCKGAENWREIERLLRDLKKLPPHKRAATVNVATVASAAGTGNTFDTNTSSLLFKGMAVAEFPITFGYAVTDDFAIGGNIKYMKARVYNTEVPVFNTDFGDALDTATDSYMDSSNFGVDVGLLYRFGDDLRVGLVGRNINSPSFDMLPLLAGDADHVTEDIQLRAGVAYKPLNFVTLAVDMDLIENDTTVSGSYKSRNLGGGVEVSLLNVLQLRAGAFKNMAESDIGVVYTAGLGLNLWAVNLDLGASMASETTTVDTSDLPKEVKVEAALSMLF